MRRRMICTAAAAWGALLAGTALGQAPGASSPPVLPETVVGGGAAPLPPATPDDALAAPPVGGDDVAAGFMSRRFGEGAPVGRMENLLGRTLSASEGVFGQEDIARRPIARTGEVLELTPGLVVTQHSGSGKANQFFVRGFNLDHGTDFAVRLDGVPINLPSHAHGQGYLDVNWLIPELISYGEYKLGPYYAEVGDFSSAGALDLHYLRSMPQGIALVTVGQFDYYRTLVANSKEVNGGQLLYAVETVFYDGPWVVPEDFNKVNGFLSYSVGDDTEGAAVQAIGYRADWTATNQIPQQAVDAGIVGRFGTLDPSDAGKTARTGLNFEYWRDDAEATVRANAYVQYYAVDLYSNFTFFLDDPVHGDQIHQFEDRVYCGVNLSKQFHGDFAEQTVGFQTRNDNIMNLGLDHTEQRQLVNPIRRDEVDQQSFSLYYKNETRLAEKVRSNIGLRGDMYRFHTHAFVDPDDSGTKTAGVFSPKVGLAFGPWSETELFLNWGQSFHSNDARGVTAAVDPAQPLVKSDGSEIGVRSWLTPTWNTTFTAWYLELDSELVFVGDEGTTEPGPPSHRFGVNTVNTWQMTEWLLLDADYAWVRPRFVGGERIPNAVENVTAVGFTFREQGSPWYATVRLRQYGPAALIEDDSARSRSTSLVNMQVGYETNRFRASVDVFNLFNSHSNDITYFYESQPAGLPAAADYHFHPVQPTMARVNLALKY